MSVSREDLREKAVEALDSAPERGFTESIDLAINLKNVDLSDPSKRIDEEVVLPAGTGREVRVCVIAEGELASRSREVGADLVFGEDRLGELADDRGEARAVSKECDFFLAEARLMPTIGRVLGPVLGPRGKMPEPLQPGVEIGSLVERLRGTAHMRSKDRTTFHVSIGNEEMEPSDLADNVNEVMRILLDRLEKRMHNIESVYIKTTMGPSVRLF